jgi:hypothetical protein
MILPLYLLMLTTQPDPQVAEKKTEFDWVEVTRTPQGDVYFIDKNSITDTTYNKAPVKSVSIKATNFTGHPDVSELFGVFLVRCDKNAWRTALAMGEHKETKQLVTMPPMPEGQYRAAPEGSPMFGLVAKVCTDI